MRKFLEELIEVNRHFLHSWFQKKDEWVRCINDFHRLNKLLKRPRYFLPSIPAIMQKRAGFSQIIKLDISMGFYTFELDSYAQQYCVISTPFWALSIHMPHGFDKQPWCISIGNASFIPGYTFCWMFHWWHWSLHQFWFWSSLVHSKTSSSQAGRKWLCHQSTQVWLGCTVHQLSWLPLNYRWN